MNAPPPSNETPELGSPQPADPAPELAPSTAPPAVPSLPAMPSLPPPVSRRSKIMGLSIVFGTFVLCLIVSYWAERKSQPEVAEPPAPPTTSGIQGFPRAVDPLGTLATARALTRRPLLRGFIAEGVRSDGSLDVTEPPGRLRYSFQSPPGHGPQPPRERGTLARQHYCGRQSVVVRKDGIVAEPDISLSHCSPKPSEPLPDPRCTMAQIWQHAIKKGAPTDRPARIEYYRATAGPAWRFELTGTSHRFALYGDCSRELKSMDAHGNVP